MWTNYIYFFTVKYLSKAKATVKAFEVYVSNTHTDFLQGKDEGVNNFCLCHFDLDYFYFMSSY